MPKKTPRYKLQHEKADALASARAALDRWRDEALALREALARERALRESAERIASDLYADLMHSDGAAAARAEERVRVLAFVREWVGKWEDVRRHAGSQGDGRTAERCGLRLEGLQTVVARLSGKGAPGPAAPPPGGALAARLALASSLLAEGVAQHDGHFLPDPAWAADLVRRAREFLAGPGPLDAAAGGGR